MQYGHAGLPHSSWLIRLKNSPSQVVWQHMPRLAPDPQSHGSSARRSSSKSSDRSMRRRQRRCSSDMSQNTTKSVFLGSAAASDPSCAMMSSLAFLRCSMWVSVSAYSCLARFVYSAISGRVLLVRFPVSTGFL